MQPPLSHVSLPLIQPLGGSTSFYGNCRAKSGGKINLKSIISLLITVDFSGSEEETEYALRRRYFPATHTHNENVDFKMSLTHRIMIPERRNEGVNCWSATAVV